MSKIETIRKKSNVNSSAGDALNGISTIILIAGIITSIIFFANSTIKVGYETETNWLSVTSGIEVLFGSIFLCIFGKAVAKIANFAQAIYKNTNADFELDAYIKGGLKFMPGDKVVAKEKGEPFHLTIKSLLLDTSGYVVYKCETETKELKDYYAGQLEAME